MQKTYADYPVLYLAYHGVEDNLVLADGKISLTELSSEEYLGDKCKNRIVVIGSCSTLAIDKRKLKRFLSALGLWPYVATVPT